MNPYPFFLLLPLLTLGACTLAFDTADYPYIGRASDHGGTDAGLLDMRPPDPRDMLSRDAGDLDMSKAQDLTVKEDAGAGEDMPKEKDMAPTPFVPKILISEVMIHPDDDNTEEWVEVVNITANPIPLDRIRFVTWGANDTDLTRAPVPLGTRPNSVDIVLGDVPSSGQSATLSSLPAAEHLAILKSTASEIDDALQIQGYLWIATDKASDPKFQLTNNPGASLRSVAVYYKQTDGTWLYQSSLSWTKGGLFSLSPTPNLKEMANLPVKERRSWSLKPDAYPLLDNLPLDTEDWCIEDSDDLVLRGKMGGKLYGSPGFAATKCSTAP